MLRQRNAFFRGRRAGFDSDDAFVTRNIQPRAIPAKRHRWSAYYRRTLSGSELNTGRLRGIWGIPSITAWSGPDGIGRGRSFPSAGVIRNPDRIQNNRPVLRQGQESSNADRGLAPNAASGRVKDDPARTAGLTSRRCMVAVATKPWSLLSGTVSIESTGRNRIEAAIVWYT